MTGEHNNNGDSYIGSVKNNLSKTGGDTLKIATNAADNQHAINANKEARAGQKAVATGLNIAETGVNAFGAVMGMGQKMSEAVMMPMMKAMGGFRGMACLTVSKMFDPVTGVDVHMVTIPPSPAPVPMPHPYIGFMFRAADLVSCTALEQLTKLTPPAPTSISENSTSAEVGAANVSKAQNLGFQVGQMILSSMGASVKVGSFHPKTAAGTPSKPVPHFPMGAGFHPVYSRMVSKTHGHALLGSLTVLADGSPLNGGTVHMHNDCWDVGTFSIHNVKPNKNADKRPVFPASLYVPSGMILSTPQKGIVQTNPIPAPINPLAIGRKLFKAGFGKLMNSKAGRKIGESLIKAAKKTPGLNKLGCLFWTEQSRKYGTKTSHPVDVSTGHFFTDSTDWTLGGILPLAFERVYYSHSDYHGPLGIGWHHTYDLALVIDHESGMAAMRMEDGRPVPFKIPTRGKSFFNPKEKLWLHRDENDKYHVSDKQGLHYYFHDKEYPCDHGKGEAFPLLRIEDNNGHTVSFNYQADGTLSEITDAAGRTIRFENDRKGHLTEVWMPDPEFGKESVCVGRYSYDEDGHLISQADALGNAMRFEYEGDHLVKEIWRNGLSWEIRYDKPGTEARVLDITGDGELFHHTLTYAAPDCTIVENSLGAKTTYYHYKGLVIKRIDPNGAETNFRYSDSVDLEWERDPLGNETGFTHDQWGNVVTRTAPDGGFTQIDYDNRDYPYLPTSAIDPAGGRWKWVYDDHGNLTKRIDPTGATTTFDYEKGQLTKIIAQNGSISTLQYDRAGDLMKTVAPDGGTSEWWNDNWSRTIQYSNPKGGVTRYEYDIADNLLRVEEPDGNVRELAYDEEYNVIRAKDRQREVRFAYRGVNKLASRTENGATLRFSYDTEDQLRAVFNEKGERYAFVLDAQGDVKQEIGFDGITRTYERNLAGQVTKVTAPKKKETYYEYDPVGRVTQVTHADGVVETYTYRKDGALLTAANPDAEVEFTRDILGRVTVEKCNGYEVKSDYDTDGNRTRITSSLGADIAAAYNPLGDLLGMTSGNWQTNYQRDLFGLETGRSMPGDIATETERDRLGRVTSQTTRHNRRRLTEKEYIWGLNDQLLSITSNGKQTFFEYDVWGNLAKATYPDGKVELRNPDKVGNLFETVDRIDRKYSAGGRLEQSTNWNYKYDDEGRLVEKRHRVQVQQAWKYRWNSAGMLEEVVRPDGSTVSFKYDALGRRIEKRLFNRKTRWVWDGNVPLHEWNEVYTKEYTEEKGEFYSMKPSQTTTWLFEEGTFVPNGKLVGEENYSIQSNYLGTPEVMYNADGKVVWSAELDAYGDVRELIGDKVCCPFRYAGQYEDCETGLYYNRYRYYDSFMGCYLSQDPIGLFGGINPYAYVNDPNNWLDKLGLAKSSTSGDSSRAEIGKEAHRQIEAKLEKIGYQTEVPITLSTGQEVRKDGKKGNIVVIIKPNTKTGRREAKKRENLMKNNGYKTYTWYYDPKDPRYLPSSKTYIGPKKKKCP